ncbi:MAG: discoidin domain-containing protein [Eubacteriales bacterium]|nr:discoidin domain-containing protein [Eubacteriales bacterium]
MRKRILKKSLAMFVAVLMVVSCMTTLLSFVSFAGEAPAANDTIEISHVNAYTWGAYYSQIIYGSGKTLNSAYDTDYAYWFVFEVQKIDGTLTVTKAFGPGVAKDKAMIAPDDGFFLLVFSNTGNATSWAAAGNLAVGDTLTADFDYTVNKSSETPIGTITIHRNYTGTNLAAGITAEEAADSVISSANKDCAILTDGVYANSDNNTSGVGMYYNKVHGEDTWVYQTLIYDLGDIKSIEGVRIQSFAKWGVWVSPQIRVYTSGNKTDWTLAKTIIPDGVDKATTILTTRADFGAIAQYVKFEFDFRSEGNMIGLAEIEILGGEAVTVSSNEMAFNASNLSKLADGSYAADAAEFGDARLVGFNWEGDYGYSYAAGAENGTHDFSAILDLGAVKGLTGIKIGAYKELASFVDLSTAVKVYLSNDGVNYVSSALGTWASTVDGLVASTDREAGLKGECIYTDSWVTRAVLNARYVKLVFTLTDPFIFLSEIEAVTTDAAGHAIDEVELKGVDEELLGETVVVITSATDGFVIEDVKDVEGEPYKFVYNSNLTWARWNVEKQAYVVTDNRINPWPDGHTGVVELDDDEILIAVQSAGSITYTGSPAKWVMWKLEVGTELHIYDDVITIGKTLSGQEQNTFFTEIDVDTTGWTLVNGTDNGVWQTALEEGVTRNENYYYNAYIDGSDAVVEIVYSGSLTGTDASFGNGNGTNFRLWYYVPGAKIGDVACTTYTTILDVSYTPSGVKDRFLNNTNPTGNTASVIYGYDVTEKPYTVESVVPFLQDGLYAKITVPLSVLGGTNAVELMLTVSNKDATLGNNALMSSDYIKPYLEWKTDKAICLYPEYPAGVTQLSDFDYLRGSEADLTDGDKHTDYAGWGDGITNALVIQNPAPTTDNGEISLLYNLGAVGHYNGFTVSLYRDYAVMIGTPKEVTISYSNDTINFTTIGTYTVSDSSATTATNGVIDLVCDFEQVVSAKYFKLNFNFSDDTWIYGATPAGGKIFFEFVALTEIKADYTAPAVQPATPVTLPEGAIGIDYAGYKHASFVSIVAGDGLTVAELTAKGNNGAAKDMNYAYNISNFHNTRSK